MLNHIGPRIERIPDNKYNVKLLGQTGLGYIFDALDGTMLSFILPIVAITWQLSSQQTGFLGSSLFFGYFFGTLASGLLGDKFGRKAVILWTLVIYSVATFFSAMATNWEFFFVARVVAGFGTGGEAAIIAPYLSELISSKYRGRYTTLLTGFFSIGHISAATLSYFLIPSSSYGWRIALFITAVPVILVVFWRRYLPESPRWLEQKGRFEEANQVMTKIEIESEKYLHTKLPEPIINQTTEKPKKSVDHKNLLSLFSRHYIWRTIMLWLVWFILVYSNFGFLTWIPSLLIKKGFAITSSFAYVLIIYVAQIPGYTIGALLNDKIGRKPILIAAMLGATISAFSMSHSTTATSIVLSGAGMSMFMNMGFGLLYTYTPEQYPTSIRATGMGATSAFSRIGGILAPIVIGYLYPIYDFTGVFTMITCMLTIGILAVIFIGKETKQKVLS